MARPQREVPWLEDRDGVYYVNWYDAGKRRTNRMSLRTRDAAEARDRFAAFLVEGKAIVRRVASAGTTVAEALDHYLSEHDCAAKWRQEIAARHLRAFWGDTPVKDIDKSASRAYAAARRADGISDPTIRRELVVLVAAANHEIAERRMPRENAPSVELPDHAPKQEAHYLSKTELRGLLAACAGLDDPRPHAFVLLAYMSGARRKSIERLTWKQVDLAKRRMRLTPIGKKETKKRAPIMPLNDDMVAALHALWTAYPESDWVFGSGGYDVYKAFVRACRQVGIDEDRAHPHVLRHTRATHMLQDGAALFDVAQVLGDTIETVERVYGHHCPDYLAGSGAFASLESVLG